LRDEFREIKEEGVEITQKGLLELCPSSLINKMEKKGTLFFDSAGHFPKSYQSPLSLIATSPEKVIRGHISQPEELEKILAERSSPVSGDLGYPDGGLAGWIDYEGNYTFGVYGSFWTEIRKYKF